MQAGVFVQSFLRTVLVHQCGQACRTSPVTGNHQHVDILKVFHCRFVKPTFKPHTRSISDNLNPSGTHARILFVDLGSAFNTSEKSPLSKLTQFTVPASTCQWIIGFLTDRKLSVRLGKVTSSIRTVCAGAPPGMCALPTALLTLH